jgi:PKD repeat protein
MATQQAIPALLGKPFPCKSRDVVIRKGTQWMAGQQQADGSFPGHNPGATVDACLALAATNKEDGVNAQAMTDYLSEQASSYATGASSTGKLIACLLPLDENPQSFGGMNLIETLQSFYNPNSGAYGSTTWDQAWAIIARKAAGADIPANAVEYLKSLQLANGGWEYSAGMGADTDSTGLVLQALAAAGVAAGDTTLSANGVIATSLTYLRATQNNQGGWGYNEQFSDTSANSTAYAIQGILAAGEDPQSIDWSMRDAQGSNSLTIYTPQDALRSLQSSAGGFQGFSGENDPTATYQALPGINEQSHPLKSDYATVQANFTTEPAPAAGTTPLEVTFNNGSAGDYTTSQWTFGDGAQSWLTSPTHTYTQAGAYTATLTVSGPGGTATTTANIQVNSVVYLPVIER